MSHHSASHPNPSNVGGKPHVKWSIIFVVAIMLIAMLIYVLTDDESLQPAEAVREPVPGSP